jgi:hypothetical protein
MNLYIDCDQSNQGWNTFDFVVRNASETTMELLKFTAPQSFETESVTEVEYKVDGRYMTVKVAKADLGITDAFTVNFAWTDNVHDEGDYTKFSGDILDFYISGDVAPGGRFKYSYVVADEAGGSTDTEPTVTEPTDDPTEAPTNAPEDPTEAPTGAPEEPTQDVVDEPKGGCKSSVAAAAVLTAAAAVVALKKKED